MTKGYWIFFIISLLILGGILLYLCFPGDKSEVNPLEGSPGNLIEVDSLEEELEEEEVEGVEEEEERARDEMSAVEKEVEEEVYHYQRTFRNPFQNYHTEVVIADLSFSLLGIAGNEEKRMAIIDTGRGSLIIREGDQIESFEVLEIGNDKIKFNYHGFSKLVLVME